MKRSFVLFCVCALILVATFTSCGEYQSYEKPVQYPDSVFGKAKYGSDKFN